MATLKDLFEEKSQDIYKRFSPSSSQPVVVKPNTEGVFGSQNRIKTDNRSVPTISVLRDTQRISKFLKSSDGFLFLAKQTLLQTGNTFANTKLYNPASVLANVVPFLHIRRNIPTNVLTQNASGLLQNATVNTVSSQFQISGQLQAFSSGRKTLLPTIGSVAKTYLSTQLKNAANAIIPLPQNYLDSRPEYKVFFTNGTGPVVFAPQPLNERGIPKLNVTANIKNVITNKVRTSLVKATANALNRVLPKSLRNSIPLPTPSDSEPTKIPTFVDAAIKFRQNFYDKQLKKFSRDTTNHRLRSKYFNESDNGAFDEYSIDPSSGVYGLAKSTKTNVKDPYNIANFTPTFEQNKFSYREITKEQDKNTDIIKFIFSDAEGNNPVYFRALLSSIKESIKPEFTEQRYVGRTERFVVYGGVKRTVSLSFNVVAFSEDEREGMWSKVNYLSGLTFPKGVKNGFMIPPLFKITIGGIYDRQPCYIETLDYDFLDESITFDIDKEVPFAINVNMQLSILEKRTKFYDSPFYKITEDADALVVERLGNAGTTKVLGSRSKTTILPNNVYNNLYQPKFPSIAERINLGEALDESGNPIP